MPVIVFLLLFVVVIVTGSGFLYLLIERMANRAPPVEEGQNLALLREEVESMGARLERLEEEVEFYKRLKAPDEPES